MGATPRCKRKTTNQYQERSGIGLGAQAVGLCGRRDQACHVDQACCGHIRSPKPRIRRALRLFVGGVQGWFVDVEAGCLCLTRVQ